VCRQITLRALEGLTRWEGLSSVLRYRVGGLPWSTDAPSVRPAMARAEDWTIRQTQHEGQIAGQTVRVPEPLETSYRYLTKQAADIGLGNPAVTPALVACIRASLHLVAGLGQNRLLSRVPGKEYMTFEATLPKRRTSRGINTALFDPDADSVIRQLEELMSGSIPQDPLDLHRALYTAAISYPAACDVTKDGDKKSPGTFLEILVGHLVGCTFGVRPTSTVTAPTLDLQVSLPTDLIFDLGPGKSRIHLPVKASTRERVIQVWAHQRVLDGMHGVNRFRGLLVVLAETNRQAAANAITEVCLPGQWTAYQMYIAQLYRVYYFDVPDKYRALRDTYPFLEVKPFADFFYESDEIARPYLGMTELVDPRPALRGTGLPEDQEV